METVPQETLDQVVVYYIQQNGITFVIENYFQIRETYYEQKESNDP